MIPIRHLAHRMAEFAAGPGVSTLGVVAVAAAEQLNAHFGVIPYVVVKVFLTKTAQGSLPMTETVYTSVKAGRKAPIPYYIVGLVVGFFGLLVATRSLSAGLVLVLAGIVVVVGAWIYGMSKDPLSGVQLARDGRWVEVPNAADRFADTVSALLKTDQL